MMKTIQLFSLTISLIFLTACSTIYPNAYPNAKLGTVYQSTDISDNKNLAPISQQQNNPVFQKNQPTEQSVYQSNYLQPLIFGLLGSAAGAAIGSQIGSGTGNTIAISTGTVLGGYAGSMVPYYINK